ncbi:glucosamine-6-phosphate isomerase [Corynebacterium kutscheri]|uniref:glucosamine-6-phosphate deaminase n=1 Tax=Corynebacterium kutscheri TaxID=35755 RepID=UPI000F6DA349|nr:glucosamine-6-phosphate deaminase [Corynebacterium kutscheri]VEH82166.1 glucosamine-6-phosphate isomerase [Corynebacterium kutscheri]
MEIIIRDTPADVAKQAADILEHYIRRGATLGLATGSTPVATYQELIRRHREQDLSFADCQAFLLDEYVGLPKDHEQSYYATIRRELTNHVDIADDHVHSPEGYDPNPEEAAQRYEKALHTGVDIQILGIGTNGHIGFNEPSSSLSSRTRVKTLHPQTVADNARFFDSANEVPRHVLTQGLGTIMRAGHLLLLATGSAKAQAVRDLVEGPLSAHCPASILQWHEKATVVVDRQAAELLKNREYYEYAFANKPTWQL